MSDKELCDWIDERIAEAKRHMKRTTDKITVAYLAGQIEAWEGVQVKVVKP